MSSSTAQETELLSCSSGHGAVCEQQAPLIGSSSASSRPERARMSWIEQASNTLALLSRSIWGVGCCSCCSELEDTFHEINEEYRGVEYLHRDPSVVAVHGFFTDEECDRLREKTRGKLEPCGTYGADGALNRQTEYRTSSEALCTQREAPTLVTKLTSLLRCEPAQLQAPWPSALAPHIPSRRRG